jgi:hypothetical protein
MPNTSESNGWEKFWKYLIYLLMLAALGGGVAASVKVNATAIVKHDNRIAVCERTGVVLETKVERIADDVSYIRQKLDRIERWDRRSSE